MQNSHPTINNNNNNLDEEHLVKSTNSSKEILPSTNKKNLQTRIIPLDADPHFSHSDIRLKIDSSINEQSLRSMLFPFPNFAKHLLLHQQTSQRSTIINPKAHLKHTLNDDLSTDNELDERIKLLDQQIKITTSVLSLSMPLTRSTSISSSITNNDKSNVNPSDEIASKTKPRNIPPPLSVISTIPKLSNINPSPSLPTAKSLTPTSARSSQYHSPGTTFSPIVKQKTMIHSPKPTTVLKSILKTPSNQSQSTSNETRKAVHIISTKFSLESTIKERVVPETKNKIKPQPLIEANKPKPIPIVAKKLPVIKKIPTPVKPLSKLPTIPKKSTSIPIKTPPLKKEIPKPKPVPNSPTPLVKKSIKFRQTSCMYDRIKARSRNDQTQTKSVTFIHSIRKSFLFV